MKMLDKFQKLRLFCIFKMNSHITFCNGICHLEFDLLEENKENNTSKRINNPNRSKTLHLAGQIITTCWIWCQNLGLSLPFFYYLFQFDSKQLNLWAPWSYPNSSRNPTGWNALVISPWKAMLLTHIAPMVSCASLWASSSSGRSYKTATTPGLLFPLSCWLLGWCGTTTIA